MNAQAQELAATAEQLKSLVARFKLDSRVGSKVVPLRLVAWPGRLRHGQPEVGPQESINERRAA